jgi:hypothetical protein
MKEERNRPVKGPTPEESTQEEVESEEQPGKSPPTAGSET